MKYLDSKHRRGKKLRVLPPEKPRQAIARAVKNTPRATQNSEGWVHA